MSPGSTIKPYLANNYIRSDSVPHGTTITLIDPSTPTTISGGHLKAQMFLRSSTRFSLDRALYNIGARKDRTYFSVFDRESGVKRNKKSMLMVQTTIPQNCPFSFYEVTNVITFRGLLTKIKHPYILPIDHIELVVEGTDILVFKSFSPEGSLKDHIYKKEPKEEYGRKYSTPSLSLPFKEIQLYGRQILEGLAFFESKNWPFPYIQTSNIILQNNVCRISDYENTLLCLQPHFLNRIISLKSNSQQKSEVIGFGLVLWEMATGHELKIHDIANFEVPRHVQADFAQLLRDIFVPNENAIEVSISSLLLHPLFSVDVEPFDPKLIKFDAQMKAMVKLCKEEIAKAEKHANELKAISQKNEQERAEKMTSLQESTPKPKLPEYGRKPKSKSVKMRKRENPLNLNQTQSHQTLTETQSETLPLIQSEAQEETEFEGEGEGEG
eukprot:c16809_g1_i2.p1 GENE.c16809_g1_i2~~c16809_g1_i2.p1  ORF type:complete len:490 (+),score=169.27 c16809_g1_i2:153-1472(+)